MNNELNEKIREALKRDIRDELTIDDIYFENLIDLIENKADSIENKFLYFIIGIGTYTKEQFIRKLKELNIDNHDLVLVELHKSGKVKCGKYKIALMR